MRAPCSARAGFALPSVLILTGVVSLIFLVAITALDTLGAQTRWVVDDVRFRQQALSMEATAAYLAATSPLTATSLAPARAVGGDALGAPKPILLDGAFYASPAGSLLVSLQDEGGLINLDALGPDALLRLFQDLGVSPALQPAMVDRLADFTDPDDLKRAQGAESADYQRAGLPPPPDAPLRRNSQVFGVLGWSEAVTPADWSRMRDVITADPTTAIINVNTAPAEALKVMFGFSSRQADLAVGARQNAPFASLEDLGRAAGVALKGDSERVYTFPNGRIALKIVDPVTREVARARLVLTPADPERPIWIEEQTFSLITPQERATLPVDAPRLADPTP